MSVIIAGSPGLVGTALAADLRDQGKRVVRLVRRPVKSADEVSWNPDSRQLDPDILRNASAIVSLGGASVGHLPWTSKYRDTLWRSRIDATRTIVQQFGLWLRMANLFPPSFLLRPPGFMAPSRVSNLRSGHRWARHFLPSCALHGNPKHSGRTKPQG